MSTPPDHDPPSTPPSSPSGDLPVPGAGDAPPQPAPDTAPESLPESLTESPPQGTAKTGLWSRMQSAAAKVASATKDAAAKVGHVTAEVARETVHVARDGVSETAAMARHTVTHFDEVRQQTGEAFAKVGKSVGESTAGIARSASSTIASASAEGVRSLVRNINEALPYIERAGYRVSEIELGLSVPPRVLLHLILDDEISDEVRAALMKDCDGKWFTRQLIERLHNVRSIQRATNFVGMAFDEIEVEIALIPSIILHYRKAHSAAPLAVDSPLADAAQAAEDAAEAEAAETMAADAATSDQPAMDESGLEMDVTLKSAKKRKPRKAPPEKI